MEPDGADPKSALVRTAHDFHGIGNMTPFLGLVRLPTPFTGLRLFGSLRNRRKSMLFQHLTRDGVDLDLGHHGRSPFRQDRGAWLGYPQCPTTITP